MLTRKLPKNHNFGSNKLIFFPQTGLKVSNPITQRAQLSKNFLKKLTREYDEREAKKVEKHNQKKFQ